MEKIDREIRLKMMEIDELIKKERDKKIKRDYLKSPNQKK